MKTSIGAPYEDVAMFGVFDGHGGAAMSKAVAGTLEEAVTAGFKARGEKSSSVSVETFKEAIPSAYIDLDKRLHAKVVSGVLEESGTTAVCVFVTKTHIVCANTGDSRAILVRGGKAEALSEDHKPTDPEETRRIFAAGGVVHLGRVDGDLAVSRAFGDFRYKDNPRIKDWKDQRVSVYPDIVVKERDPTKDQYIVIACDGIWDVVTNDEVATHVSTLAQHGMAAPDGLAHFLIDQCLRRGSRDNMSVIVVKLDAAPAPSADKVAKYALAREAGDALRQRFAEQAEPMIAVNRYCERVLSIVDGAAELTSAFGEDGEAGPESSSLGGVSAAASSSSSSSSTASDPAAEPSADAPHLHD
jgi:serine/threonine protein phosphatase PrpC